MSVDHFIDGGGAKALCLAMIEHAASALASKRNVGEVQETVLWVNGKGNPPVSFDMAMHVLGAGSHIDSFRKALLDDPRAVQRRLAGLDLVARPSSDVSGEDVLMDFPEQASIEREGGRHAC